MKKYFYLYKENDKNYVEAIDTGNFFSVGNTELKKLYKNDRDVIEFLSNNNIINTSKQSDVFSIMILVNNYCNLKCKYCFEDGNYKKKQIISNDLLKKIKKSLHKKNDITFSGGEPLLSVEPIMRICKYIEENNYDSNYSLITNGLNLNEKVNKFLDYYQFEVQVSFDGCITDYNVEIDRTNRKIELTIMKNLLEMLETTNNIKLQIRVNFTKHDLKEFKSKINYIIKYFCNYLHRISFDLAIVDLPKYNPLQMDFEEKSIWYLLFNEYLLEMGIELPSRFINGGYCFARNENSLLVDSEGDEYPCFSFVGNKKYKNDRYQQLKNENNFQCDKDCLLHSICFGGCIYENYCSCGAPIKQCHFNTLDKMNKILFLMKLYEMKYIAKKDFRNEEKYVETFSINI